jgi:hypothetical protein
MSISDFEDGDGLVADIAQRLKRRGIVLRHDGYQSVQQWLQELKRALDAAEPKSEEDAIVDKLTSYQKGSSTYKMERGATGGQDRAANRNPAIGGEEEVIRKITTTGRKDVAKFGKSKASFGATTPR